MKNMLLISKSVQLSYAFTSEYSCKNLAYALKMNNPALIIKWVNDFRIACPETLRTKQKGRKKSMNSGSKNSKVPSIQDAVPVDTSSEHIKPLEEKILQVHSIRKDFGYRHMRGELRKQGGLANKKRVQRRLDASC